MTNIAKHLFAASAAVLAAGGALAAAAGPAHAKDVTVYAQPDEGDARSRRVGYADLQLASVGGQKTLDARVSRAVRYVCSPYADLRINRMHGECIDFAWNGARPQMARAIERAQQLAATGTTSIAPVAISIRAIGQ